MPINSPKRVRQVVDFDGVILGGGMTDIDGFVEYDGKMFIFYEFKLHGTPIPKGQRLAYQHITDALIEAGKYAVTLLCDHNDFNWDEEVNAKNATVREAYFGDKWIKLPKDRNIQVVTNEILDYWRKQEGDNYGQ